MNLKDKVLSAPERCGVYIFKGKKKPVYIGKAKNIKRRLLQHLKLAETDPKESAIVREAVDLEWIVTRNEFEALVLEIDLIQTHRPRFNVMHKHGGGYPLILITADRFPTVKVVRRSEAEGGEVFGPFLQAGKARKVKRLIHRVFKLRTCDPMPKRSEPCMDYHLGLCSGPCAGLISEEDYRLSVEGAKALLSGEVSEILPKLYSRIEELSREMLFEKCAQIRDQIVALENIAKGQAVSGLPFREADLFYRIGGRVGLFLIRSGRVVSKEVFDLGSEDDLEEFLIGYYYHNRIPELVIGNFPVSDEVKRWLRERAGREVGFSRDIPEELRELAEENLKEGLTVPEEDFRSVLGVEPPEVIEGFDVSHFQGEGYVGSCVVWEEGRMNRRRYRRYRIKTLSGIDDYGALREVLERRARRLKKGEERTPDIWLIDGGKGQLGVGVSVKKTYNLPLKVFALAKEEEILFTEDGREIRLKDHPALYRVFGLIRDEAHRFALSYSRKLRGKKVMEEVLSKVKGVGEVRKRIIYRNFETLYDLISADDATLRKLGLPVSLKQEVKKYLG
ncbi:MAG: excinuclease ABC subunit UvrC [Aquificota bacterium]|nr:excinuclease ABC subunit UvrC [Aquificota bacterium]